MNLTNMKLTADEMKAKHGDIAPSGDMPKEEYPWGLRLNLGKEELEKLGMKDLPAVGTEMMLVAKVKIIETRQSATEEHDHKGMELQITDMTVDAPKKPAADVLYAQE